jgi:hypothetical protein
MPSAASYLHGHRNTSINMSEPTLGTVSKPKLNVLVFGAALRADSLNRKLAALAARVVEQYGATVDHASMHDFDVPAYDGDAEKTQSIPKGAGN